MPVRQPDLREEKKGPRVGAPDNAIVGFLKAAGLKSIGEAKVQPDKKGDFYVAVIERPGRSAIEVIGEILPDVIKSFPWPKSMRWGAASKEPGALTWVRPLHSIVATFGPETEEPDIVPFEVGGIAAGNETRGHRFLAPEPFAVRRLDDYMAKLDKAKVVLDPERRRTIILTEAKQLAFAQGLELVADEGLLAEVAGLVEWPVVLMGSFDASFLQIPEEVIRATIRTNQKCFVLRDAAHAKLVNKFLLVSNMEAEDGGKAIVAGNERVIRARLSDAKFFYETDLKNWRDVPLEERLKKFGAIVFNNRLSEAFIDATHATLLSKINRIEELAAHIAPFVGADLAATRHAARLCKADLLTEMVGEFPELQGTIGKYYALAQGEPEDIALACEDHYKPRGPDDRVPDKPISIAVALADKIDTLAGFWAIADKPTGSKDPYGLRRSALGVIAVLLTENIKLSLTPVFLRALALYGEARVHGPAKDFPADMDEKSIIQQGEEIRRIVAKDLLSYFTERLKGVLREEGARHDLVDAVLALGGQDDLLLIVRRVEALGKLLDTDDGKNLLAGTKRANNILDVEEKRDSFEYTAAPNPSYYQLPEETALAEANNEVRAVTLTALALSLIHIRCV